ncbi:MAG: biopolymer transporter ExbD [Halioglobus sp.]|jgi:biopolymer transport protein TolR
MTRIPRGVERLKWRRQRQEKLRRWPTLNLIALMDVFTILVLFFLVHSTGPAPGNDGMLVELPESLAAELPRDTPVVTITRDGILLEGELLVTFDPDSGAEPAEITPLVTALAARATVTEEGRSRGELTIRGDRSIHFDLLNRVMQACTRAGYGNIALSVLQRPAGSG